MKSKLTFLMQDFLQHSVAMASPIFDASKLLVPVHKLIHLFIFPFFLNYLPFFVVIFFLKAFTCLFKPFLFFSTFPHLQVTEQCWHRASIVQVSQISKLICWKQRTIEQLLQCWKPQVIIAKFLISCACKVKNWENRFYNFCVMEVHSLVFHHGMVPRKNCRSHGTWCPCAKWVNESQLPWCSMLNSREIKQNCPSA